MKELLIIITGVLAFALPIVLAFAWTKKTRCSPVAYLVGAMCFILFAYTLESFAHYYFLYINKTSAEAFNTKPILYGIYAALMAGLFEETGRLFGFKVLLKKFKDKAISVGYGIGHGGIECVLTLGATYLMYSVVLLGGSLGDALADSTALSTINAINAAIIPFALIERVSALILHISLSIIMFKAVRVKKCFYLYIVAILIHMIADIPAGLYQAGILTSIPLIEILTLAISLITFYFAIKTYKSIGEEKNA